MSADFSASKTQHVYEFLKLAATDNEFREGLKHWKRGKLKAELAKFGVVVEAKDIKDPPRTVPSKAACGGLIKTFGLEKSGSFNPYATSKYDYNPSTLAGLMMVIGYAMPLAAVDGEATAAG